MSCSLVAVALPLTHTPPPPPLPLPFPPPRHRQLTAPVRLGVALGILLMALMALCQSVRLAVSVGFTIRVAAAGVPDSQALLAQTLLFMRRSSLYFAIALRLLYAWSRESEAAAWLPDVLLWFGGRGAGGSPAPSPLPRLTPHPVLLCSAPSPRLSSFHPVCNSRTSSAPDWYRARTDGHAVF